MDFFDAYEELYSAVERFVDEHSKVPSSVSVSPVLFRWLLEMKKEAVSLHFEDATSSNSFNTRFGAIPIVIDEMLSPYDIVVD